MVEILTKGQLPDDKSYQATCHKCNTVFEFQAKEAIKSAGRFLMVECPLQGCEENILIDINPPKPSTYR